MIDKSATFKKIQQALSLIFRQPNNYSLVLFYFRGYWICHTAPSVPQHSENYRKTYLSSSDIDSDDPFISGLMLKDTISRSANKSMKIVIIIDCCYYSNASRNPTYLNAYGNKGLALGKLGKYNEAIECYDAITEIDPKNVDAYNSKAAAYTELGKYNEAIKCYNKAIEVDPQSVEGLEGLGLIYSDYIYDFQKALEQSFKLKQIRDDPSTTMNLAEDLLKVGEYEKARKFAIEASKAGVEKIKEPIIRLHILCSYMLENDMANAEKQLSSFYDSLRHQNFTIGKEIWMFRGLTFAIANGTASLQTKFIILTLIDLLDGRISKNSLSIFSQF